MLDKITKNVSTKMYEGGDAVVTTLTMDFTGLTPEDIQEIAASAAVIKWQTKVRNKKVIPATDTYKVPKPGTRAVVAPLTDDQLMDELVKRGLVNRVLDKVTSAPTATQIDEETLDIDTIE